MELKSIQIKIYNYTYTIEFKTNDEIKKTIDENRDTDNTYIGACKSYNQVILLSSEIHEEKVIPILVHEITHAIINDKGYNMKAFDTEDLCCFVEANFCEIQRAVEEFLYKQGQGDKMVAFYGIHKHQVKKGTVKEK